MAENQQIQGNNTMPQAPSGSSSVDVSAKLDGQQVGHKQRGSKYALVSNSIRIPIEGT